MKISKQFVIFALFSILSIFQIIFLYSQNTKSISFYPKWSVFFNDQTLSISTNQGFFAQIIPANDQSYMDITKQSNSLIVNQSTKTKDNKNRLVIFELVIKYCTNCFIIDLNRNKVFTKKNQEEDIVLKKTIIINGYSVEKGNIIDLSQKNIRLVIFNPISEEMIAFDDNIATVYIDDLKKEVRLEIPYSTSQKFTFL